MFNELFQFALLLWQPPGLPADLVTGYFVIPYLAYAAAAVSAYSAIRQGQAGKATASYNAAIQEQNAARAKQQAGIQAEQSQRETYLRLGTIKANAAKNGGTSDQGSVLDVLGDSAAQGELQRQSIIRAGDYRAQDSTNTALLDTYQGQNAETAGYTSAASSLIGAGSTAYTNSLLRKG